MKGPLGCGPWIATSRKPNDIRSRTNASSAGSDGQPCDSLYVRRQADGVVVASEPLDGAAGWSALPEQAVTGVAGPAVALDGAV